MEFIKRSLLAVTIGTLLGLGLGLAPGAMAEITQDDPLPLAEARLLAEVMERIRRNYVDEVDDTELLRFAVRGMLEGLDPHSSYLDPEGLGALQVAADGEYSGVGLEVVAQDGRILVVSPIDGTPAARAGILPGDTIIRVDGHPLLDTSVDDGVDLIRGPRGTEVVLTILRDGVDGPLDFTLVRAAVEIVSARGQLLESGIGYLRVAQFSDNTGTQLADALRDLVDDNEAPLSGVVLDLRNNPGGLLDSAVEVSDLFLDGGNVVSAVGRAERSSFERDASAGDALDGAALVVLVNEGTASASEIVAGALQDHGRALIAGHTTFGKGSVQTVMPLSGGTAIKLTTSRYFTPSGRSIQAAGIVPDVLLERVRQVDARDFGRVRESDLEGHLAAQTEAEDGGAGQAGDCGPGDNGRCLLARDSELYQAVNLLKAMRLADRS
jgi:carboxyl-terminal processing protease